MIYAISDLLPKFAKVDIGIDHIELILCYTLTKIKQSDIIEVEKLLKSKLNPKKRENIMKSIAHHWMQEGREEEKAIMAKKMLEKNKPLDEIIYFTGLAKEEVEKLK